MKQKFTDFFQRNGFYVLAVICVIALAAVITVVSTDTKESTNQVAENAAGFTDGETEVESAGDMAADAASSNDVSGKDADQALDYTEGYNADEIQDIITQIEESEAAALAQGESSETSSQSSAACESSSDEGDVAVNANAQAAYDGSVKIAWPVAGNILIDFSMDTTTYFQTLDQYKCNPGILIGAEVNTPVTCAYGGVVESIYGDDEYGTCIVVNMGNDYRAIYGQVKDVAVSEGQAVTAGQQLAFVAQPSRYYTLEGSHLFFEITKDDISVNPHNYLN